MKAKICGISTSQALASAIDGGAAYVGFVFYPPSPRAVNTLKAARLSDATPSTVARVGLFVDPDDSALDEVIDAVRSTGSSSTEKNLRSEFSKSESVVASP